MKMKVGDLVYNDEYFPNKTGKVARRVEDGSMDAFYNDGYGFLEVSVLGCNIKINYTLDGRTSPNSKQTLKFRLT